MSIVSLVLSIRSDIEELNVDELRVVSQVVQGLRKGREVYGPLDIKWDKRNMVRETMEEVRDALVYVGTKLAQLEEE